MDTKEREVVVVSAPLECKYNADKTVFCTRIRALGLTAYGESWEESKTKLKKMFATWVGLHRRSNTLEVALNRSKLVWCYESQYTGERPYEVILDSGKVRVVTPKTQSQTNTWQEMKEMVAAH
jgi:hypothetical protein